MALSRSFILSIGGGAFAVLLELLLLLPGSPAGSYLESLLGVSTATIITWILAGIGIVILVPCAIVIAITAVR